jgi:prepilin-type N-terminal cleavage/methylation domain-containing protein
MKLLSQKLKGFTLIEVMVAVSIFTVVVTIGIGALMSVISTNKRIQAQREVVNGLSFALETMGRRLRLADVSQPINTGSNFIQFLDSETQAIILYQRTSGNKITVSTGGQQIEITPAGFEVTKFESNTSGTGVKKFITLRIVGNINAAGTTTPISMQTSISPRSL